ncbi:unnamed protein product [Closterium sp. Naga37s-1]|nr:unnamed protein product [Closterium sp. Naga37s-1]
MSVAILPLSASNGWPPSVAGIVQSSFLRGYLIAPIAVSSPPTHLPLPSPSSPPRSLPLLPSQSSFLWGYLITPIMPNSRFTPPHPPMPSPPPSPPFPFPPSQSSFLWGYLITPIIGGSLADRYGGRPVLAAGLALWSLATLLTPSAAAHSLGALLTVRAVMGLGEGVALPCMNHMVSRYVCTTSVQGLSSGSVCAGSRAGALVAVYPAHALRCCALFWRHVAQHAAAALRAVAHGHSIPPPCLHSTPMSPFHPHVSIPPPCLHSTPMSPFHPHVSIPPPCLHSTPMSPFHPHVSIPPPCLHSTPMSPFHPHVSIPPPCLHSTPMSPFHPHVSIPPPCLHSTPMSPFHPHVSIPPPCLHSTPMSPFHPHVSIPPPCLHSTPMSPFHPHVSIPPPCLHSTPMSPFHPHVSIPPPCLHSTPMSPFHPHVSIPPPCLHSTPMSPFHPHVSIPPPCLHSTPMSPFHPHVSIPPPCLHSTPMSPFHPHVSIPPPCLHSTPMSPFHPHVSIPPPCLHSTPIYVPENRRAWAVGICFAGFHVGSMLGLLSAPSLMAIPGLGLTGPFLLFGALGLLWLALWLLLIPGDASAAPSPIAASAATPSAESGGQQEGKQKMQSGVGASGSRVTVWQLLSHPASWAIIIANTVNNWGYFILLSWMPLYFNQVLHTDIRQAAWFSAGPWVVMAGTGLLEARMAGYLQAAWFSAGPWAVMAGTGLLAAELANRMEGQQGMTRTAVRKVMQTAGFLGPAASLLLLTQMTTAPLAALCLTAALGLSAFSQAGWLLNHKAYVAQPPTPWTHRLVFLALNSHPLWLLCLSHPSPSTPPVHSLCRSTYSPLSDPPSSPTSSPPPPAPPHFPPSPPSCQQDIAPRHVGLLHGLSNTAGTLAGITSTVATGFMVEQLGSFYAVLGGTSALLMLSASLPPPLPLFLPGLSNTAGTLAGITSTVATGFMVEQLGSFHAVLAVTAALYVLATVFWLAYATADVVFP